MNDKEWREWIEAEMASLKERVKKLEGAAGLDGPAQKAKGKAWKGTVTYGGIEFEVEGEYLPYIPARITA